MVQVTKRYCRKCEHETIHHNGKCGPCNEREEKARIAAWNAQTVEERIQDLRRRVEELERGPARY
jgi:hypothetical protein